MVLRNRPTLSIGTERLACLACLACSPGPSPSTRQVPGSSPGSGARAACAFFLHPPFLPPAGESFFCTFPTKPMKVFGLNFKQFRSCHLFKLSVSSSLLVWTGWSMTSSFKTNYNLQNLLTNWVTTFHICGVGSFSRPNPRTLLLFIATYPSHTNVFLTQLLALHPT